MTDFLSLLRGLLEKISNIFKSRPTGTCNTEAFPIYTPEDEPAFKQSQAPAHLSPADTKVTISKQQLALLQPAHFNGKIKVIDNPDDIASAVAKLRESDVIGFDTETRPSFKKGQTNMVSLLQLSTRKECFLFRLNIIGLAEPLVELLEDANLLKIGLSIHDDFHNLNKIASLEPKGFIDLQQYVKDFRIADNSLSKIYAVVFGKRISKGQRLTNWEAENLTPAQQSYAALDALACINIYDFLKAGKFQPEKSPYLVEIVPEPPQP